MGVQVASIAQTFESRTSRSRDLYQRARNTFPSGVTHDSRYLEPYPISITRAEGSRKWDVDGNEYVDYFGGHGALILGHNHPAIVEAVADQLSKGTHFGASHEVELEWGEQIRDMIPSAEKVRFTGFYAAVAGTGGILLADDRTVLDEPVTTGAMPDALRVLVPAVECLAVEKLDPIVLGSDRLAKRQRGNSGCGGGGFSEESTA